MWLKRFWYRCNCLQKLLLILIVLALTIRLLPYFAPIRARDLQQQETAITFSDRQGLPLGTILTHDQEHTSVIPLQQISPLFLQAILATEDSTFYQHGALDLQAIARAIFQAIKYRQIVSGASTITMQLARMLEPAPRTIPAKFKEIWLSWRLSAGMSKQEILAAYLNRLPMGSNIYGIEAASRIYFGISAQDLNLAQASILAAIPNNPNYLNPYDYWENLKKRQQYVLKRMLSEGYISLEQQQQAYDEKIILQPRQQGIIAAPHFLFWLFDQLKDQQISQVQTSLDRPLQQFVETQVKQVVNSLAAHNVNQGAAIVINNHSGEVLAYVGSIDYFNEAKLGRNDGVQALRQPGSTLKPFLYQLALEKRLIRANTVLADVPTHYALPGAKIYSPTDYTDTFTGPVRIRIALANSLNVPAVRVLEKVGVDNFLARLQELGFSHLNQTPEYYGLGLTLGSGEVSLWELARAYLTIANQGQKIPLSVGADSSISQHPHLDYNKPALLAVKIQNPETWALITDILSDRHARAKAFGVDSLLNLPFPTAVKTGTSSNWRDTWTVGFSNDYTVATWVGNFTGEPMYQVSGVMGAAPLWQRIMLHLHENKDPASFSPPTNMIQKPICALSGLKPTPACPVVVSEYFYPEDLADYEANPDTFYQLIGDGKTSQYRLNLPPEYNEWLAQQSEISLVTNQPKIIAPRNGDVFLISKQNQANQKLEFRLAGNLTEPVEWWLNGEKIATTSSNSWFWQMRQGEWTLEAKSNEIRDKIQFQVEVAKTRKNRRGFSVNTNSKS